jgi:hypothetical protein
MAYTSKVWNQRVRSRVDISSQVAHLTRGAESNGSKMSALQVLIKILRERTIRGSTTASGFIVGARSAVCFHDAPAYSLCQNIDFERFLTREEGLTRMRYEALGLMFPKPYAYDRGARPVFYERTELAKQMLPPDEWWRIVGFDMSDADAFIDWTRARVARTRRLPFRYRRSHSARPELCYLSAFLRARGTGWRGRNQACAVGSSTWLALCMNPEPSTQKMELTASRRTIRSV